MELRFDEEVAAPADEIERTIDLEGDWAEACSHENVFSASEDVERIWKQLIERSGLKLFDTITHGFSGLTFIEKFVDSDC